MSQKKLLDYCTWDDTYQLTLKKIQVRMLEWVQASPADFEIAMIQGTGNMAIECILASTVTERDKLLIICNGHYGKRLSEMAFYLKLDYLILESGPYEQPDLTRLAAILDQEPGITHVAMVHCETKSGILNHLAAISQVVKSREKVFIVDAVNSFGLAEIQMEELKIDFLAFSLTPVLHRFSALSFVAAEKVELRRCQNKGRSYSLHLYNIWRGMAQYRDWHSAPPAYLLYELEQALADFEETEAFTRRFQGFGQKMELLCQQLGEIGLINLLKKEHRSPYVASFQWPHPEFDFSELYQRFKAYDYPIFPSGVMNENSFRLLITERTDWDDIERMTRLAADYLGSQQ